jgi:RimJ/RimL family protein N-acetyltransferase
MQSPPALQFSLFPIGQPYAKILPMIRLIEIANDGRFCDGTFVFTPQVEAVINATVEFYELSGYKTPWVSYLGLCAEKVVGVCSFKSAPKENQVEVAYFTFPEHENRGYASEMLQSLLKIANSKDSTIRVSARTLKDRNASHRVLEKCGFEASDVVVDPDDGEVLEWFHKQSKHNS